MSNTATCDGIVNCPNGFDESPDICGKLSWTCTFLCVSHELKEFVALAS